MALPPGIKARSGQLGVPTPYVAHVHPYPTRYHGGIWTRPVFGFPYVTSPQSVFKPDDFYPAGYARYPWAQRDTRGLGANEAGWGVGMTVLALAVAGVYLTLEFDLLGAGKTHTANRARRKVARHARRGRK